MNADKLEARNYPDDYQKPNGQFRTTCWNCGQLFYGLRGRRLCRLCDIRMTSRNKIWTLTWRIINALLVLILLAGWTWVWFIR